MKKALVLESDGLKGIIAKHYGVNVKNAIKSQYTYTVILDEEKENNEEGEIS